MTERQVKLCVEEYIREKLYEGLKHLIHEEVEKLLLTEDNINWNADLNKLYHFQHITDTREIPSEILKPYVSCVDPTNNNIIQYKDRNEKIVYTCSYIRNKKFTECRNATGKLIYCYRKTTDSQYYLMKSNKPGKKRLIRCSNHYSAYLYPKYWVENPPLNMPSLVTCVFGTRSKIGNNYYAIELPKDYKEKISQEEVRNAMLTKDRYYNGYVVLNRKTCDLLDNKKIYLWGETNIDESDNSAFWGA
jgi:hypothetical protein